MLVSTVVLRGMLDRSLADKRAQGYLVDGVRAELRAVPDDHGALLSFADRLAELPMREDWPFREPDDLPSIRAESDQSRSLGPLVPTDPEDVSERVRVAFLASVAGCVLGKPVEINPTLEDLKHALTAVGAWPLADYIPEAALEHLPGPPHPSWEETVRERIAYVAPDDDLNYTLLGMLVLERHGASFTTTDVRDAWLHHLPIGTTFGPERTMLLKAGLHTVLEATGDTYGASPELSDEHLLDRWVRVLNPRDELCGALIRADAYGYAAAGNPELASELAWKDARFTHRKTGVYGTMFVAAAIATAMVIDDRLEVARIALRYVPQESRFAHITRQCIDIVAGASDWLDAYEQMHSRYGEHDHCTIYQEVGTLINTLAFAESVGDGICKQVSQGNDTDSYGATAGSLLGAYFGPGHLDDRWVEPFNDDLHTALAWFYDRSLTQVADRISDLPMRLAGERLTPVPGDPREAR